MNDGIPETRRGPGRRLLSAFGFARGRLGRRRDGLKKPAWTWSMTILALVACAAVYAASFFDATAIVYAGSTDSPVFRLLSHITDLGRSHWYLVPAGVAFLLVGMLDWRGRKGRAKIVLARVFGHAGFAFSAIALSGILINIAKFIIGRARPKLFETVGPFHFEPFTYGYLHASFPSGHSTTCGAVAAVLMLWFPRFAVPAFVVGAVLAFSRVAAKAHYPSDVAAGYAIGLIYTIFLARWLANRHAVFRRNGDALLPVPR